MQTERKWSMYVAVLASSPTRATATRDRLLDLSLENGCYSTFLSYPAGEEFLAELERKDIGTVVLHTEAPRHLLLAESIIKRKPEVKLILLGSDEVAAQGYSLQARYCAGHDPDNSDLKQIVDIIFPPNEG